VVVEAALVQLELVVLAHRMAVILEVTMLDIFLLQVVRLLH
jgi:hypothetical protein